MEITIGVCYKRSNKCVPHNTEKLEGWTTFTSPAHHDGTHYQYCLKRVNFPPSFITEYTPHFVIRVNVNLSTRLSISQSKPLTCNLRSSTRRKISAFVNARRYVSNKYGSGKGNFFTLNVNIALDFRSFTST
jgi:hypothetical protein